MRKTFLSFGIVLALVAVFFTTTAFTNAPTAQAATRPHARVCNEGWVTDGYSLLYKTVSADGGTSTIVNNTSQTITRVVSTSTTLTISLTLSASGEFAVGTILAQAKTTLGLSVQSSVTINRGESTTIPVAPRKTVRYGDYIRSDNISFHNYYRFTDCSIGTDNGYFTMTAPEAKYWEADEI